MRIHPLVVVCLWLLLLSPPGRAADFPEIPGWKASGPILTFNAQSIWQAIDGAAETYLAYGFRELRVGDVEKGEWKAAINLYDQGSPLNAFGVYHRERGKDARVIPAGAEGAFVAPYQCVLWKQQHYVKVEMSRGKLTQEVCLELLTALSGGLPGTGDPPTELTRLPAKNRIDGSIGYTRKSYLGLSELEGCLHADYQAGKEGKRYQLFTFLTSSTNPANGLSARNSEDLWKTLAAKWKPAKHEKLSALIRDIPYRGPVAVALTPGGIYGVTDAGDPSATLATLAKALPASPPSGIGSIKGSRSDRW